jgi:hypothetical protein
MNQESLKGWRRPLVTVAATAGLLAANACTDHGTTIRANDVTTADAGINGGLHVDESASARAIREPIKTLGPPPYPPIVAPPGSSCPDVYPEFDIDGWNLGLWDWADSIIWRESRCMLTATHHNRNGSIDYCWWQLNDYANAAWIRDQFGWSMQDLLEDGQKCMTAAKALYDRDGPAPWELHIAMEALGIEYAVQPTS